ncbi:MAG: right-handed parallel beta-helix repeat-containing protein [Pseudomonadota bacterium]
MKISYTNWSPPWRVLTLALAFGLAQTTYAASFCVTTTTELKTALTMAAFNGEDDNIQVVQGTYEGNFVYVASEEFNLSVKGGYKTGCVSRAVDPSNTVLNGGGKASVLILVNKNAIEFVVDGLTIENGETAANANSSGGGLHISTDKGDVTLSHSIISGNKANFYGGGAYIEGSSTISISDNTISDNTAHRIGGVHFSSSGTATFTDNIISGNTGNNRIGGVYFSGPGTVTITNNTISDNTASYDVGGVYFSGSGTATFTDNIISGNTTTKGSAGGVYFYSGKNVTLINNVISGNITDSGDGGGIYINSIDTITLTNNTITSNTAGGDNGGGIWLKLQDDSDVAHIYNNIIWNNSATSQGGDLYINNDGNNNFVASTVNLFNNDFDQTLVSGIHIALPFLIDSSNLNNLDPLFVDADDDNYHLQASSPCIEAGDNEAPEVPTTDKDGNPRNNTVDIGAHEYQSSPLSKVQFSSSSYEVNESDGTATISVTRTGSNKGAISVKYATSDDTATEGEDYIETSGRLQWANGDKSKKTFTVDIIDDIDEEGEEELIVSLGNPAGAVLGTPDTATLSILDDDIPTESSILKISALTGGGKLILKVKPKKGFKFSGWGGDCQSKKKKITVPMDTDRDCSLDLVEKGAAYEDEEQIEAKLSTLTITAPTGSSKLILKAKPNKGFKFKGWKGDCKGKKKTTVPMNSDRVCMAEFVQK